MGEIGGGVTLTVEIITCSTFVFWSISGLFTLLVEDFGE